MEFLVWIEGTELSLWMGTAYFSFPLVLTIHSIAMGFLVGVHLLMNLRILGLVQGIPLPHIKRFFPLVTTSFLLSLASGLLLLIAYPAKALLNPVFYLKMLLLILAFYLTRILTRQVLDHENDVIAAKYRYYAICSLCLWVAVITTGRLLAYTYTVLLASEIW